MSESQASPKIDAARAEKDRFRMETKLPRAVSISLTYNAFIFTHVMLVYLQVI
jgi:hypothetical protein